MLAGSLDGWRRLPPLLRALACAASHTPAGLPHARTPACLPLLPFHRAAATFTALQHATRLTFLPATPAHMPCICTTLPTFTCTLHTHTALHIVLRAFNTAIPG